jgi:hypothetical protein
LGQLGSGEYITLEEEYAGIYSYQNNKPGYTPVYDHAAHGRAYNNSNLYIPNKRSYHTVIFDFYTPERHYPGCDPSATNTFLCRNNGSLKAGVTHVQRLPPRTVRTGVDGGTGELAGHHLQYAVALSDTLVTHERLTTDTGSFRTNCYKPRFGWFDIGYPSPWTCDLAQPKYLAFTPIGAKAARCGSSGYQCRVRITVVRL